MLKPVYDKLDPDEREELLEELNKTMKKLMYRVEEKRELIEYLEAKQ